MPQPDHNNNASERTRTPRLSVWKGMIVIFAATAVSCLFITAISPTGSSGRQALQVMLLLVFAVSAATALHLLSKWLLQPLRAFAAVSELERDAAFPPLPANACDEIAQLHQQLKALVQATRADNINQHAEAERMRLIIDHHPKPLLAMDDRGFVSYINLAARTLLALDASDDCIGRPVTELTHHMIADGRRYSTDNTPLAQAFREGIRWHSHNEWFMDNHGNRFAARYDIAPIREQQQVLGAVMEFTPFDPREQNVDGHDELATDLAVHLGHVIARAQRHHYFGAVMLLQLNNLAAIVETAGADIATPLLHELARRVRQALRREDMVSIHRPNQLALCLPELAANSEAAAIHARLVAQQLLAALKPAIQLNGIGITADCRLGLTLFPEARESADAALRRADMALFEAEAQQDPVYLFSQLASDSSDISQQLQQDLGLAIERGQLVPHYQKIVDNHGKATGIEALLRWQHPQRGLLGPEKFLPLAANNRLMLALDQWMLQQTVRLLAERRPDINHLLWISVNISELSLRQPFFADGVQRLCLDAGIQPERLCLDIPATVLATGRHEFAEMLAALKRVGVRLALDDFGACPLALTDLADCPVQYVKLAQRFLLDGSWERARDTLQMLLAVATLCGKTIIAEGVENDSLQQQLADCGCHLFQGHAFGPPRALNQMLL